MSHFSKFHCRFRKGSSAQQCLLSMFEKWKSVVYNKKSWFFLTNLSEAFVCLIGDLLIVKLRSYGFSIDSLRLVLFVKSQTRNQNKFSVQLMGRTFIWSGPSINFRASFFNIFLGDLFLILDEIDFASYADNNIFSMVYR